jgi:hypothetical protein
MKKIDFLLTVAQYPDNIAPKMLATDAAEWIKDSNFFVFPYASPMYRPNLTQLKRYHYLQRVDVFYAVLTSNN